MISAVAAAAPQWPVALRGGTAWDSPAGCRSAALRTHILETPWPAWTPAKQTLVISAACSAWEPHLGDKAVVFLYTLSEEAHREAKQGSFSFHLTEAQLANVEGIH